MYKHIYIYVCIYESTASFGAPFPCVRDVMLGRSTRIDGVLEPGTAAAKTVQKSTKVSAHWAPNGPIRSYSYTVGA